MPVSDLFSPLLNTNAAQLAIFDWKVFLFFSFDSSCYESRRHSVKKNTLQIWISCLLQGYIKILKIEALLYGLGAI